MHSSDLLTRFTTRVDLHQSPMHRELMQLIGWETHGKPGNQLFLRRLGPLSIAKIQRPQNIDLSWLNQLRKQHHIFTLYIEPGLNTVPEKSLGFSVEPFAHSATSLIDLKLTESALLTSFSQKTRYNITKTLKKNTIQIRSTPLAKLSESVMHDLFELRTSWSKRKGVVGYPEPFLRAVVKSYAKHGTLHTAYEGDECIAALLILSQDRVATYYAAFATPEGYRQFAPTLLTWVAIQTDKKNGCDIFDFGGIYDARYPKMYKKWQGFTKFKEGFSPTIVSYPPTYLKLFW
jgi:lipid II:glycine glycyltransferase (peptidoglycan interpeptide bridge formation enzyme)